MKQDEDLWKKEERFWLGDADFYEQALAPDAIMVLPPPAGILDHAATIESIRSGTRWRAVSFSKKFCRYPTSDTAIIVYVARANRDEPGSGYLAQCSSTYAHGDKGWQLVLHHQTPAGQDQ